MREDAIRPVVERARSGDAAAYGELFRAYERDVARLCRRLLGSAVAAEDAMGEVFLRARHALHTYDSNRPFRRWLLAIAGHHCVDQLRRRTTEAHLFDARELETSDLADPGPSPLRHVVWAEERQAILVAIEGLPVRYRLPVVLRYFAELDYGAIAEVLGVTRDQVGTLLFRAKRRLREHLAAATEG